MPAVAKTRLLLRLRRLGWRSWPERGEPDMAMPALTQSACGLRNLVASAGVPYSAVGMAAAFHGPERAHWRRLALTHGSLGLAALVADRPIRRFSITRRDISIAAGLGGGLFAASSLADIIAQKFMPELSKNLNKNEKDLYATSSMINPLLMFALLTLVIAPGEELFWRRLLQQQLTQRYGTRGGTALTNAIYCAAHVGTGNLAVTGGATCMGIMLSLMRANGASTERLALTHALWVTLTLQRIRYLNDRRLKAQGEKMSATEAHPLEREGVIDMPVFTDGSSAGRKVTQWGRFVQLVNNVAHVALYEKTRGRLGGRMLGNKVAILTTTKRRNGEPYSVPVFAYRDGRDVIIVASYRGSVEHPAWFRNLLANPDAVIRIGDHVWPVRARVMEGEERAAWWDRVVDGFNGYAEYQRRTSREIPIVRLAPRPGNA
jgi:F420H(2)-dependent quinone reductase